MNFHRQSKDLIISQAWTIQHQQWNWLMPLRPTEKLLLPTRYSISYKYVIYLTWIVYPESTWLNLVSQIRHRKSSDRFPRPSSESAMNFRNHLQFVLWHNWHKSYCTYGTQENGCFVMKWGFKSSIIMSSYCCFNKHYKFFVLCPQMILNK